LPDLHSVTYATRGIYSYAFGHRGARDLLRCRLMRSGQPRGDHSLGQAPSMHPLVHCCLFAEYIVSHCTLSWMRSFEKSNRDLMLPRQQLRLDWRKSLNFKAFRVVLGGKQRTPLKNIVSRLCAENLVQFG